MYRSQYFVSLLLFVAWSDVTCNFDLKDVEYANIHLCNLSIHKCMPLHAMISYAATQYTFSILENRVELTSDAK